MQTIRIRLGKRLKFPEYVVLTQDNLVIAPNIPSWLYFHNDIEKLLFDFLASGSTVGESIQKCIELYGDPLACMENMANLIAQINAKGFNKTPKKENKFLEKMKIYITNACNLRCKHCFILASKPFPDELTTDEIKTIIKNFTEYGGKIITITGGEPLIRKDIFEILSFAKDSGLFVVLLTNGTLINKANVKYIIENVDQIQISIDGSNEETHDAIRGKGTFRKVMRAIELLADTSIEIFISMTPVPRFINMSSFEKDLPIFLDNLRNIKNIKAVNINLTLLPGRSITTKDIESYSDFASRLTKDYLNKADELVLGILHPNVKISSCGYAETLTILPNGDVKPCYPSPIIVGNIRKESFVDIIKKLEDIYITSKVDNIPVCSSCPFRYFCGGWCRVKLSEFNSKDYRSCPKAQKLINAMKYFDKKLLIHNIKILE